MQRILVALSEETVKDLEYLASKRGTSRAEIIRLAADSFIRAEKKTHSHLAIETAFGLWKDDPMSDDELQDPKDEWSPK